MTTLLPRVVQVAVGPAGQLGRAWTDLAITATVTMVSGATPNKAQVEIYNLNDLSIALLKRPEMVLQLMAGEGTAGQLFYGDVTKGKVKTEKSGEDWITRIEAADGRRKARSARFTASYPPGDPGFSRTQILTQVLANAQLARGHIAPLPERYYPAGAYFNAYTTTALRKLFLGEDVEVSIQNDALQVVAAGETVPGNVPVISARTGMIDSPKDGDKKTVVAFRHDGSMRPGRGIKIQSRRVDGVFRATKVVHRVSNWDEGWSTEVTGVPVAI
jgi:hypothetical protein